MTQDRGAAVGRRAETSSERHGPGGHAHRQQGPALFAAWAGGAALSVVVLLNAVPYGLDLYVRHISRLNFYDVARRGAFAELVDRTPGLKREKSNGARVVRGVLLLPS